MTLDARSSSRALEMELKTVNSILLKPWTQSLFILPDGYNLPSLKTKQMHDTEWSFIYLIEISSRILCVDPSVGFISLWPCQPLVVTEIDRDT